MSYVHVHYFFSEQAFEDEKEFEILSEDKLGNKAYFHFVWPCYLLLIDEVKDKVGVATKRKAMDDSPEVSNATTTKRLRTDNAET